MIWTDVASLNYGSDRQRDAYQVLIALDLLSVLADYDPMLVGAYLLGLEREDSVLQLVCHAEELGHFAVLVEAAYGNLDEFELVRQEQQGVPTAICRFEFRRFRLEIAAQPYPSEEQAAYRRMLAEASLLRSGGEEARLAVRQLMDEGATLEGAFARYFCLEGAPGDALLAVADMLAGEVEEVVLRARYLRRGTGMPVEPVSETWL